MTAGLRIPGKARTPWTTRLFGWALLAAVCGFLLWIVFDGAARAEDPKAAARALGQSGQAAAGAIARDAANAGDGAGLRAGTNVPERQPHGRPAWPMRRATCSADAGDPGGDAGRAVIEGTVVRPDRPVSSASDAEVQAAARHDRGEPAGARARRIGARFGRRDGVRRGRHRRRDRRWIVRRRALVRGRRLREHGRGGEHRLRRGDGASSTWCSRWGARSSTATISASSPASGGAAISISGGSPTAASNSGLLVGLADCSAEERELASRAPRRATPTISGSTARSAPSSGSASAARGPGACSARSSGASSSSRAARSSGSAGGAAGA